MALKLLLVHNTLSKPNANIQEICGLEKFRTKESLSFYRTLFLLPLETEAKKKKKNDPEKWQLEYRMGEFIPFGHDRFKALNKDSYVDAVKQMQEWGTSKLTTQFATENITPDAGSAESRALGAITTNWSTTLVGMLRAKDEAEFNKLLEGYKAFQKSNDIDAINDIRNEKIKLNEEKLAK